MKTVNLNRKTLNYYFASSFQLFPKLFTNSLLFTVYPSGFLLNLLALDIFLLAILGMIYKTNDMSFYSKFRNISYISYFLQYIYFNYLLFSFNIFYPIILNSIILYF